MPTEPSKGYQSPLQALKPEIEEDATPLLRRRFWHTLGLVADNVHGPVRGYAERRHSRRMPCFQRLDKLNSRTDE